LLFSTRHNEVDEIFGANGHDLDGTHVDISIELDGRRLSFLPVSVFTPLRWQARRVKKYRLLLEDVRGALSICGFQIHQNPTESLQVHCDFVRLNPNTMDWA
jgi:hypothetical protein